MEEEMTEVLVINILEDVWFFMIYNKIPGKNEKRLRTNIFEQQTEDINYDTYARCRSVLWSIMLSECVLFNAKPQNSG